MFGGMAMKEKLIPVKVITKLSSKGDELPIEIDYEDETYKVKDARKSLKYPGKYTCMVSGNQVTLVKQGDYWYVEMK